MDRATTTVLAVMALCAVVAGPLVPGSLPASDTPDDTAAFSSAEGMGVTHRLSFQVDSVPATVTMASVGDGYVADTPAVVTIAAADDPVTVRFRLETTNGTYRETARVPAGECRTVRRAVLGSRRPTPGNATFVVQIVQGNERYTATRKRVTVEVAR